MLKLKLKQIRTDGGTQMRVGPRNQEVVREYADVLKEGGTLPPVLAFHDGQEYWLADGFHRYSAHMLLDWREIDAEVREGSKRDAILYAVGANTSHGLRRSNADKRRAVETLLKDAEWGANSDNWIAKQVHVSQPFVSKLRHELAPLKTVISERRTSDGRTMQIGNIGQRVQVVPDVPAQVFPAQPVHSVDAPATPPTSVPEVEVQPYAPRTALNATPPAPPILEPEGQDEPVIRAEDLYIPFHDPEPPSRTAEETQKGVKDIHNALERLLKRERDGRGLLATPDPYTRSVRNLARHARDMLDEWLENGTDRDSKTISVDALN